MIIDIFRWVDGYALEFNTSVISPAHMISIPLQDGVDDYLISIDPGTVSLGMTISDTRTKTPYYWINIQRDKVGVPATQINGRIPAEDQSLFVSHFLIFFEYLLTSHYDHERKKCKFKYLKIEAPFVDRRKAVETYAALKKVRDGSESLAKSVGMYVYSTPPKSWESWYLSPYKTEWNLNLNSSNKDSIKRIGIKQIKTALEQITDYTVQQNFHQFLLKYGPKEAKSDVFDAHGLACHFYEVDYSENDIIRVNPSMPRSQKNVTAAIFTYREKPSLNEKSAQDTIQMVKNRLESRHNHEVNIKQFIYCANLSAEENIKAVVEHAGEEQMYVSVTPVTVPMFADLYTNVNFKSAVNPNSILLIVGYREI